MRLMLRWLQTVILMIFQSLTTQLVRALDSFRQMEGVIISILALVFLVRPTMVCLALPLKP